MRQWRLIYDQPMRGPVNMAVDESIMEAVASNSVLPTLRLYNWNPLCLSIGYGQRVADVDPGRLKARNWDIVRRPTGGKAILHGDELTYSLALPRDHALAQGDVVESYRRISQALLAALQLLGLQPQSEKRSKGNSGLGPVCFEVPSHYEITSGGKKLIGSAQVRRREGILQHGTLPLYGDIARICEVLAYENDEARERGRQELVGRATTLASVVGEALTWDDVAEAVVQGFADTFGLTFEHSTLSRSERDRSEELLETRYDNPEWLNKR